MKKLISILFIFICFNGFSQDYISAEDVDQENVVTMQIDSFPADLLPKGFSELRILIDVENNVFHLIGKIKDGRYKVIHEMGNEITYNHAKNFGNAVYSKGFVSFCSEMPFRASQYCPYYKWEKGQLVFDHEDYSDPSAEAVEAGNKYLEEGKISQAINSFYSVFYPMNYMNEAETGMRLLFKAHEIGMKFYQEKDYKNAAAIMDTAYEYWYWELKSIDDLNNLLDGVENYTPEKFTGVLADYGLFLLKAENHEKCITVNTLVNNLMPALSGPYLQLADACYKLGKKTEAKVAYNKYKELMIKEGKEAKIPERVGQRIGEK
ncbi:MAG: hypothetical protein A2W91_19930 [Bacteroidetes bacterium GWF2_38_335]|nr:MAG: hypothetical protein A2W91_19930 [Bacteroidetes bacterium GWF2_38_335]OFY82009.1 MAG: hypothetical protein A2281_09990 [Bacteroidetes bacterium RIFOXYA12_FULL_38_20]HBS86489.1 hypothetical protein [Bacteroidales bacterium]